METIKGLHGAITSLLGLISIWVTWEFIVPFINNIEDSTFKSLLWIIFSIQITYKRMLTNRQTPRMNEIGTFETITRNLNDTKKQAFENKQLIQEQQVFIDNRSDGSPYLQKIGQWKQ